MKSSAINLVPKLCTSKFGCQISCDASSLRRRRFTSKPRGRERSERTLGRPSNEFTTLKGLHNRQFAGKPRAFVLWNPDRVRAAVVPRFPGWRGCAADPGLRCETPSAYSRDGKLSSLSQPRSQTLFGNALPRNSVSQMAKQSFAGRVFPSRSLGTSEPELGSK